MNLDIEIGKKYMASFIAVRISEYQSNQAPIKIGHALIERIKVLGKVKVIEEYHDYHLGIIELGKLKDAKVKVLSIVNPCEQNFAYNLIMLKETQDILNEMKTNKRIECLFTMDELINGGYKSKGIANAIKCFNCVLEKNEMPYKAVIYVDTSKGTNVYYLKIINKSG